MDRSIRIRRAVMENKRLVVFVLGKDLMVNVDVVPELEALGFVFRQVRRASRNRYAGRFMVCL